MQTPNVPPPSSSQTGNSQSSAGQTNAGQTGSTTSGGTTASLPSGTATVPSLPPSLAQALQSLPSIPAQVTAVPQNGQLTLTTQNGQTLQVQTALPLPVGTNLALSLQSTGSPTTLFLQPQTGLSGQGAAASTPVAQPTPQPAVVTTLTLGSVFNGVITTQGSGASGTVPGGASGTSPSATPGNVTGTTLPSASTPATQPPAAGALPAGTNLQVRLLGIAPPGQPFAVTGTAGSFVGTVTGQSSGGATLIQSSFGTLSVSLPTTPSTGTRLLLDTIGAPRLPMPGSAEFGAGGARFQALQDAITLLRGSDPAMAQRLTQSLIPQPNAQLGMAVLFLANSLRQGGADRWLGSDTARTLAAADGGKSGLLSKLSGDLVQGRASDSAGQDWRVSSLPFLNAGQVEQIRLYMRDTPPKDADSQREDGKAESKRFVIEADFSRLGPIQFDGLARERQVDVMIRTQRPLEQEARDDIRDIFIDTVSALGLSGRVDFMVVPKFDLIPDSDTRSPGPGGLTV